MSHYIILWNWTEKGVAGVKEAPRRISNAKAAAEKLGGKLSVYYTLGEYDTVGIAEFPNDEALASFVMSLGVLGNVRSTSLRAFSESEGSAVIASLGR